MRCNKHLSDNSSSVGVCASCLRERLFPLVAAAQALSRQAHLNQHHTRVTSQAEEDPPPPRPSFPRSVSPYVTRRKSDDTIPTATTTTSTTCPRRFYSTPQVRPTYNNNQCGKMRNVGKFSLLSNLFRSRSDKCNSNPRVAYRDSIEPSSSSSWFFSTLLPSRRKNKSTLGYGDDSAVNGRKACSISNRGMSPARESESDDDCGRSTWGSGDSADEWRRTPVASMSAARRLRTTSHGKNASGLAFCLSPLVRASPNRHWNQKGGFPPELVCTGEIRKPRLSTAASFCANRSRKLADFGRANHNR